MKKKCTHCEIEKEFNLFKKKGKYTTNVCLDCSRKQCIKAQRTLEGKLGKIYSSFKHCESAK